MQRIRCNCDVSAVKLTIFPHTGGTFTEIRLRCLYETKRSTDVFLEPNAFVPQFRNLPLRSKPGKVSKYNSTTKQGD